MSPALPRFTFRRLLAGEPAIAAELWRLDAVELAEMIRRRDVSCREVVSAALGRLDAVNPRINAVVRPLHEPAQAEAAAADTALARGAAVGPLHGVPITTKVNVDQAGCPTDNGVVAFKDLVATRDNPVVANLRRAGAIGWSAAPTPPPSRCAGSPTTRCTARPWNRVGSRAHTGAARAAAPPRPPRRASGPSATATTSRARCATRPTAAGWSACG